MIVVGCGVRIPAGISASYNFVGYSDSYSPVKLRTPVYVTSQSNRPIHCVTEIH